MSNSDSMSTEELIRSTGVPEALEAYRHGRTLAKLDHAREALELIALGKVKGGEARRMALRGLERSKP